MQEENGGAPVNRDRRLGSPLLDCARRDLLRVQCQVNRETQPGFLRTTRNQAVEHLLIAVGRFDEDLRSAIPARVLLEFGDARLAHLGLRRQVAVKGKVLP